MKYGKRAELEKELKRLNVPFWKVKGGYYLHRAPDSYATWPRGKKEKPRTLRECWHYIAIYDRSANHTTDRKKFSASSERARVKDNIAHERYEEAELREGKVDKYSWL